MKDLIKDIYPLHRTLNSDGTSQALRAVWQYLPEEMSYEIKKYYPGTKVWTWKVPPRWHLYEAYIEDVNTKERIVDAKDSVLHVASYSHSIDQIMTGEELLESDHIVCGAEALPWRYHYYEKNWSICATDSQLEQLNLHRSYRVVIKTGSSHNDPMEVGVAEYDTGRPGPTNLLCGHSEAR